MSLKWSAKSRAHLAPRWLNGELIMTSNAMDGFWQYFQKRESELAKIDTADHPVYDELLEKLQSIDSGLWFEFHTEPGRNELIITADGCTSLFPLVEEVVSAAPNIPGWTIIPLKPKSGFPKTAHWKNLKITISDVVFDPLECEGSDDLGIRIFVPGIRSENIEDAHNAILRAIDHGLGERKFAECLQHTEVKPLPGNVPSDTYIPITDLEPYIDWRKKKLDSERR